MSGCIAVDPVEQQNVNCNRVSHGVAQQDHSCLLPLLHRARLLVTSGSLVSAYRQPFPWLQWRASSSSCPFGRLRCIHLGEQRWYVHIYYDLVRLCWILGIILQTACPPSCCLRKNLSINFPSGKHKRSFAEQLYLPGRAYQITGLDAPRPAMHPARFFSRNRAGRGRRDICQTGA